MKYDLYDHISLSGKNEIKEWTQKLQSSQLAKLNQKLDSLEQHGLNLRPQMLTDSGVSGILKLRVHGGVQLRPLLCRGPVDNDREFTLLLGAKEIGSKWVPKDAPNIASTIKREITLSSSVRRVRHERVGK